MRLARAPVAGRERTRHDSLLKSDAQDPSGAPLFKIRPAPRYPVIADQRQNGFDSLRVLFAVLVIFSHCYPLTFGNNDSEPLAKLAAPAMVPGDELTLGAVSVWAFFVLSGFLITKSWQRSPSAWSYLKKRIRRIYPGFLVAVSVCALLQIAFADPGAPRLPGLGNFLYHSLRLQIFDSSSVFASNPVPNVINGSLWSIPYEFWCYIGVLALGVTGWLRSRWIVLCLLLVVTLHAWMDYRHWLPGGMLLGQILGFPLFWARVLPFFLAGMFFALNEHRVQLRPGFAAVSALVLVAATPFRYAPSFVYPVFGSYVLLFAAFSGPITRLDLGRWGDFSYGTYLYAFPIQQLLVHLTRGRLAPIVLFFLAAPLSLGAGALSWFCVERWFLSRATRPRPALCSINRVTGVVATHS
jgi:peptidoglycan/LPS O-acetylase OafA/YrhL